MFVAGLAEVKKLCSLSGHFETASLPPKCFTCIFLRMARTISKPTIVFFNGFCCSCEQLARHVFRRLKALATVFGADVSQMSLYVRSSRKFEVAGKALCLLLFFFCNNLDLSPISS